MIVQRSISGLGQIASGPTFSLATGGPGMWILAAVLGYAIGWALTKQEYVDEHGHPVDKHGHRL